MPGIVQCREKRELSLLWSSQSLWPSGFNSYGERHSELHWAWWCLVGGTGPILHLGRGGPTSLIFVVSTRLACGDSIASSNRSQEDETESN